MSNVNQQVEMHSAEFQEFIKKFEKKFAERFGNRFLIYKKGKVFEDAQKYIKQIHDDTDENITGKVRKKFVVNMAKFIEQNLKKLYDKLTDLGNQENILLKSLTAIGDVIRHKLIVHNEALRKELIDTMMTKEDGTKDTGDPSAEIKKTADEVLKVMNDNFVTDLNEIYNKISEAIKIEMAKSEADRDPGANELSQLYKDANNSILKMKQNRKDLKTEYDRLNNRIIPMPLTKEAFDDMLADFVRFKETGTIDVYQLIDDMTQGGVVAGNQGGGAEGEVVSVAVDGAGAGVPVEDGAAGEAPTPPKAPFMSGENLGEMPFYAKVFFKDSNPEAVIDKITRVIKTNDRLKDKYIYTSDTPQFKKKIRHVLYRCHELDMMVILEIFKVMYFVGNLVVMRRINANMYIAITKIYYSLELQDGRDTEITGVLDLAGNIIRKHMVPQQMLIDAMKNVDVVRDFSDRVGKVNLTSEDAKKFMKQKEGVIGVVGDGADVPTKNLLDVKQAGGATVGTQLFYPLDDSPFDPEVAKKLDKLADADIDAYGNILNTFTKNYKHLPFVDGDEDLKDGKYIKGGPGEPFKKDKDALKNITEKWGISPEIKSDGSSEYDFANNDYDAHGGAKNLFTFNTKKWVKIDGEHMEETLKEIFTRCYVIQILFMIEFEKSMIAGALVLVEYQKFYRLAEIYITMLSLLHLVSKKTDYIMVPEGLLTKDGVPKITALSQVVDRMMNGTRSLHKNDMDETMQKFFDHMRMDGDPLLHKKYSILLNQVEFTPIRLRLNLSVSQTQEFAEEYKIVLDKINDAKGDGKDEEKKEAVDDYNEFCQKVINSTTNNVKIWIDTFLFEDYESLLKAVDGHETIINQIKPDTHTGGGVTGSPNNNPPALTAANGEDNNGPLPDVPNEEDNDGSLPALSVVDGEGNNVAVTNDAEAKRREPNLGPLMAFSYNSETKRLNVIILVHGMYKGATAEGKPENMKLYDESLTGNVKSADKDNGDYNMEEWLAKRVEIDTSLKGEIDEAVRKKLEEAKALEKAKVRQRAEEEARQKGKEEAKRQAEEEEEARRQAEEEARQRAETEARQRAEEEKARQLAEEEARQKAEEEARQQAQEDARRKKQANNEDRLRQQQELMSKIKPDQISKEEFDILRTTGYFDESVSSYESSKEKYKTFWDSYIKMKTDGVTLFDLPHTLYVGDNVVKVIDNIYNFIQKLRELRKTEPIDNAKLHLAMYKMLIMKHHELLHYYIMRHGPNGFAKYLQVFSSVDFEIKNVTIPSETEAEKYKDKQSQNIDMVQGEASKKQIQEQINDLMSLLIKTSKTEETNKEKSVYMWLYKGVTPVHLNKQIADSNENVLGQARVIVPMRDAFDPKDIKVEEIDDAIKKGYDMKGSSKQGGRGDSVLHPPIIKTMDNCIKVIDHDRCFGVFHGGYTNCPSLTIFEKEFEAELLIESTIKKQGNLIIFGYGFSGSGKTYLLLDKNNPHNILAKTLNYLRSDIKSITVKFKELYPIALDATKPHDFTIYEHPDMTYPTGQNKYDEGTFKLKFDEEFEKIRLERVMQFRIAPTPNNPDSSRSHIFVSFEITFNDGTVGKLTLIDMAGSENTIEIKQQFLVVPGLVTMSNHNKQLYPAIQDGQNLYGQLSGARLHQPFTLNLSGNQTTQEIAITLFNSVSFPETKTNTLNTSKLAERFKGKMGSTPFVSTFHSINGLFALVNLLMKEINFTFSQKDFEYIHKTKQTVNSISPKKYYIIIKHFISKLESSGIFKKGTNYNLKDALNEQQINDMLKALDLDYFIDTKVILDQLGEIVVKDNKFVFYTGDAKTKKNINDEIKSLFKTTNLPTHIGSPFAVILFGVENYLSNLAETMLLGKSVDLIKDIIYYYQIILLKVILGYVNLIVKQGKGIVTTLEHLKYLFLYRTSEHIGLIDYNTQNKPQPELSDKRFYYDEAARNLISKSVTYPITQKINIGTDKPVTVTEIVQMGYMKQTKMIDLLCEYSGVKVDWNRKELEEISYGTDKYSIISLPPILNSKFVMFATLLRGKILRDLESKMIYYDESSQDKLINASILTLEFAETISSGIGDCNICKVCNYDHGDCDFQQGACKAPPAAEVTAKAGGGKAKKSRRTKKRNHRGQRRVSLHKLYH